MELNCFTVFPLGNYLNKNLSLSCSLDTKASHIFKTSFRRQKYAPVFFKRHVIFLNISVGSAVLWQHTSNNMKKSIPFVCRYYLCLQDYFGTFLFFSKALLEYPFSKLSRKKKSVIEFTVKWKKIFQCTVAWFACGNFSLGIKLCLCNHEEDGFSMITS